MIDTDLDALRAASTLILTARALEHHLRAMEPDGLAVSELSILRRVQQGNNLPSTIARAMQLDPARVTRITDRLVSLGLLKRAVDAADRRRCVLTLTAEGAEQLSRGLKAVGTWMEEVLRELSPRERDALNQGLEGLRRQIDALGER